MDGLLLQFAMKKMPLGVAAAAATILAGVELARLDRIQTDQTRNPRQLYLCLSTPHGKYYESQSDRAFITTMGLDVQTFGFVLASGFGEDWLTLVPCT